MEEVVGIFPTPFMRVPAALRPELVSGLVAHFSAHAAQENNSSANLAHTAMLKPSDSPLLIEAAGAITPLLGDFGALLFGERLGWSLKEMWVNVLDTGGRQAMHNHANSFISGVAYLTRTHPEARTGVLRRVGVHTGRYNADKWISMPPEPGDVVLFPSYLLHAVPTNPGERRISLAFNAIPTHLDSWGYKIA